MVMVKIIGYGLVEVDGGPDEDYNHWIYFNNHENKKNRSKAYRDYRSGVYDACSTDIHKLRLCLKLKDELPIISGTGEQDTPYQLVEAE